MPNVLLINPATTQLVETRTRKFHRRFPPLSLLYMASMFRNEGWTVKLADLSADPMLSEAEVIDIANFSQLVILTTNPFIDWQCPSYEIDVIINFCQKLPPERLVLTGNHGTHYPGDTIKKSGAKMVVRGEPESIVLSIAKAVIDQSSLENVDGISYQDNGKIKHNKMPQVESRLTLPKPAYDLVDLNNYRYELIGNNFALIETTRGCPYTCSFCNLSMFAKSYRKRPIQHILDEIDELVENHGCRSLYICDLEFAVNAKMATMVSEHLIERNYAEKYAFRWTCQTRADSVTPALLELLKKSGCELIHFGVESGNGDILSATNKRIDKDGIRKGIFAAQKAGIKTAAFFMFGFPGENINTYQETLRFALELDPTYASFHPLLAFPGSPLYTKEFGEGPYWDEPLPLYKFYFSQQQENEVNKFVKKAYKKFYLRPRYIWKQLNHGNMRHYKMQFNLFRSFVNK